MPSSINNNLISLFGQRSLATTQTQLAQAVERLGSGLRINRAKDDSAGLGIGQELIKQTRSAAVAMRNAQDAISMAQTAEGALNNVSDMLGRLKELAAQGANDALSGTQRSYITQEMAQIRSEINSVANRTSFNGLSLLTGDFSQAVKGEFKDVISAVTPQSKSVLRDSITQVGAINDATVDPKVSRFSIKDIQVDSAEKGTYTINADGSSVTLTLSRADGTTKTDSVKIAASAEAALQGEAVFNNNLGESFTLDFDQLGVQISIQNEKIGSNDRNSIEIATKIAAIGLLADPELVSGGWTTVQGAAIADASKYGLAAGATLKAVITSSEQIKIGTATGLGTVTGYSSNFQGLTADVNSGRYEIAFTGTQAQLNAALETLQVNSTDGKGDVLVDVIPSNISVFTNPSTGTTSYYEVVTGSITWSDARQAALGSTFSGMSGYLTNITNAEEDAFLRSKVQSTSWIGAYEKDTDGEWYWADGPESDTHFWSSAPNGDDYNGGGIVNVTAGALTDPNTNQPYYTHWSTGPTGAVNPNSNNALTGANLWNWVTDPFSWDDLKAVAGYITLPGGLEDHRDAALAPAYLIEYGGEVGDAVDSSKTLLVGKPGSFEVGDGLVLRDVQLSGINTEARMNNTAGTGTFKISADASARTVTLQQFDMDGETLLGSETISHSPLAAATGTVDLVFNQLGVSLSLENVSDRAITLGEGESGLSTEVSVATSQTASLIGEDGPTFQTGHSAYSDVAANLFKDTRLGKNTDAQDKDLFNQVGSMITDLAASSENASTEAFNALYNKLGDLLDEVSARRSNLGAMQNRLQASINNVNEQAINLEAAQGQIMNTDYAAETARMTRMQIGQQAATAMLAQANQLPNVILALLQ